MTHEDVGRHPLVSTGRIFDAEKIEISFFLIIMLINLSRPYHTGFSFVFLSLLFPSFGERIDSASTGNRGVYVRSSLFNGTILFSFPLRREGIFYHRNLQLSWAE